MGWCVLLSCCLLVGGSPTVVTARRPRSRQPVAQPALAGRQQRETQIKVRAVASTDPCSRAGWFRAVGRRNRAICSMIKEANENRVRFLQRRTRQVL